jgi:hypothetical protein
MKKKTAVDRITYYLKKVAQKGSVHPSKKQPRSYTYRNERLRAYKAAMHVIIENERRSAR